jgi:hypothetical protein
MLNFHCIDNRGKGMKKAVLAFLFFSVALGVFAQSPGSGVIREMTGTVEIMLPGTASFATAKPGDRLSQDTVISTGFRSFASIEIGHSLITVRPLSRLTLTEIQSSTNVETLNVSLQAGRVRVDVKPPAGVNASMSIASTLAVASVRGTSFEFDTRNLYVSDGTVSFMGTRGQLVQVGAGANSRVDADARATNLIESKTTGLLPPTPMGSDIAGVINSGPTYNDVAFTIELKFPQAN